MGCRGGDGTEASLGQDLPPPAVVGVIHLSPAGADRPVVHIFGVEV